MEVEAEELTVFIKVPLDYIQMMEGERRNRMGEQVIRSDEGVWIRTVCSGGAQVLR
jgi:hypothetical protein